MKEETLQRVREILLENPATRDDDLALFLAYYGLREDDPIRYLRQELSFSSLARYRRKCQELYPETAPSKQVAEWRENRRIETIDIFSSF